MALPALKSKPTSETGPVASRPDIYGYHDYRVFLRDFFLYRKAMESSFSLRALCREANLASGYLPMVLSGLRSLSGKALAKLARPLGLQMPELSYLELLCTMADADSPQVRLDALERIQRFRSYRELNPREIEVYRYLTRWYYVAIREMTALEGFRADAAWIQERLRAKVPLKEIEQALEFLKSNGYLEVLPDGTAKLPQKDVQCVGGVYRIALAQFHREMLTRASDSLSHTSSEERTITGHTVAVAPEQYDEVKRILDEALTKIAQLPQSESPSSVYHVALAAFPLTKPSGGKKS